jgi:hypothetical protein
MLGARSGSCAALAASARYSCEPGTQFPLRGEERQKRAGRYHADALIFYKRQ